MTHKAKTRTRGPYAKTAKVRERILDAGVSAFAETGYHATTIKEIAERADISERGLVHHFPSKAALLSAVLERREGQNQLSIENATPGLGALLSMLQVVATDGATPGLVELHSIISAEAASTDHPGHEHYRFRYDMLRMFAAQCFAAIRANGNLDSCLTDEELGASYVALSDGLQLQWLYNRDDIAPASILRQFLRSVIPSLPSDD